MSLELQQWIQMDRFRWRWGVSDKIAIISEMKQISSLHGGWAIYNKQSNDQTIVEWSWMDENISTQLLKLLLPFLFGSQYERNYSIIHLRLIPTLTAEESLVGPPNEKNRRSDWRWDLSSRLTVDFLLKPPFLGLFTFLIAVSGHTKLGYWATPNPPLFHSFIRRRNSAPKFIRSWKWVYM